MAFEFLFLGLMFLQIYMFVQIVVILNYTLKEN